MKKTRVKQRARFVRSRLNWERTSRKRRLLKIHAQRKRRLLRRVRAVVRFDDHVVIAAPERFRYYAPRAQRKTVEKFFQDVDDWLRWGRSVTVDFSATKILFPCGLLVLMGWVDEWVSRYEGRIRAVYPETDLVEQMLQHVDILPKLGLAKRRDVSHNDVVRWHYFSGRNVDPTPIEPFMLQLQQLLGEENQVGLGNCVTEAMVNVRHHAYDGDKGGPWWIFATVSDSSVFMALYDRGSSIPATLLEKPGVLDYLTGRMWALGRGDGKLITAAVGGRTSTELPWRGKGLPEMLEFTRSLPSSELGIFSRRGFFRFDGNETSGRLKTPINGTLMIWMLNFDKGT